MKILVTGVAGFIGFHTAQRLLHEGYEVIGIDNINDYYDVTLKEKRLQQLQHKHFTFYKVDITDQVALQYVFQQHVFERIIHLAAQAGVRYSITNPEAYIQSNIVGYFYILECARQYRVSHVLYASSSSVYGANDRLPFAAQDQVDQPISLYAATKKSNELMAHSYSSLYQIPTTGLRFFTAYGPWGRPDMALFTFTEKIINGEPIDIYNNGEMLRDFTYIDDIVDGIFRLLHVIPQGSIPYDVFNIGNNQPVLLLDFIETLEKTLGRTARKNFMPLQQGDVINTFADITPLQRATGFRANTSIVEGIEQFVAWYIAHYQMEEAFSYESK